MSDENRLESLLKRDRAVVSAALLGVIALGWLYVLAGAGMGMNALEMSSLSLASGPDTGQLVGWGMGDVMAAMAMPVAWSLEYAVLVSFMWWVMMIAMMLPSAAPMILLHARVSRGGSANACRTDAGDDVLSGTAVFGSGYLAVWAGFSIAAAGLQFLFERAGILSPMMLNSTNVLFAGGILIVAGLYQLTPMKRACLDRCRSPIAFLSRHWRDGVRGAFMMGVQHGAFCLGCCWGLMLLLFFGGVMNLYWIVGLAIIVLLEKLLPVGPRVGRIVGALLLLWGAAFLGLGLV